MHVKKWNFLKNWGTILEINEENITLSCQYRRQQLVPLQVFAKTFWLNKCDLKPSTTIVVIALGKNYTLKQKFVSEKLTESAKICTKTARKCVKAIC